MAKKVKKSLNPAMLANKESESNDPYKVIGDFFSAASLEHYRKYISSMLKAAYSEDYWKRSDPGSLLHFQDQMLQLMKAAYYFVRPEKKEIKRKKKALVDYAAFENGIDPASYYGWHRENAMWEFFPRNLTKHEFLNPFKAYERFFEYKEIQTWLKEFKELISYALESFGNDSALDFDYLEIHKYLQKLVEASHLIEVRVNKPKRESVRKTLTAGETKEGLMQDKEFTDETENYTSDPYLNINQFFLDGSIEDGRDDLSRMFEAAFPDGLISKKHYPSLLVYIFERLDKLIDSAFTINQEWAGRDNASETELETQVIPQVKMLFKKGKGWRSFPHRLTPFEWVNPRLAVKAFFEHQPLSHWKGKLHELLQASIKDESICYVISDRSKLYLDCSHLERLVEAMWVIKVLEL